MTQATTLLIALQLLKAIRAKEIDGTERRLMVTYGGRLQGMPKLQEVGAAMIHFAHMYELPAGETLSAVTV